MVSTVALMAALTAALSPAVMVASILDDLPEMPAMDFDAGAPMDLPGMDADPDMAAWNTDGETEGLPDLPALPDLPPLGGDDGGLPDLSDLSDLPMGTPMDLNLDGEDS